MGRKKQVERLNVFLNQEHIGLLIKETNGAIEFRYSEAWIEKGFAISLSLPLADKNFSGDKASFYFDNLLPDSKKILEAIATKFGAESTGQFDLLHAVGRECVGALSFFDEEEDPKFIKKMDVRELSEHAIAHRIMGLASDSPLGMEDGDFRLSLAGAQEKMALLYRKGRWYEPKGQTPTSHIIKKKMGEIIHKINFEKSVDNEWTCLFLARKFGIRACEAEIKIFEAERVLCVERFDRAWKDNFLHRIPQEDFCQSLGISPTKKYERNSGPSIKDIMEVLKKSNQAEEDRKAFFKTAMFNDLIYNIDGHAKNFSIHLVRIGFILTPMYDLLSAHFVKEQNAEHYKKMRSSLSVNSKFNFDEITLQDWENESKTCSLPSETFTEIVNEFKESILKIEEHFKELCDEVDKAHARLIFDGVKERAKTLGIV